MLFPLRGVAGVGGLPLSARQVGRVEELVSKIASGSLVLIDNACLCARSNQQDFVLAEVDRYGVPIPTVICLACGMVRSLKVFDELSTSEFYINYYRGIYDENDGPSESFFQDQKKRGHNLLRKFSEIVRLEKGASVVEIGCGAGGILSAFVEAGFLCRGVDFDKDYLAFGKSKGLALVEGDYRTLIDDNSVDLIILSHVFEHFTRPRAEILSILRKLRPGGYLLIEVPGLLNIHRSYDSIIEYIQGAHPYSYCRESLEGLVLGTQVEVLCSDQQSIFIVKKNREIEGSVEWTLSCSSFLAIRNLMYLGGVRLLSWIHLWKMIRKFKERVRRLMRA